MIAPERYPWFAVLLMWLVHLIYFSAYTSVGALGPLLKQELGLSNTQFGILCAAVGVGTTSAQLPGGMWCDRLGVRKVVTLSFVGIGMSVFVFSVTRSLAFGCFVLFVLGLAVGCSQIAGTKAVVDWFPSSSRAAAMGIKQTGVNAGGTLASLVLPLAAGLYGWRFLYRSMGVFVCLWAVLFTLLYRDAENKFGQSPAGEDSVGSTINGREMRLTNRVYLIKRWDSSEGIHIVRCSLPIPATMNVYFVRNPMQTIIDTPPAGSGYLDELDRGLRSVGSSVRDIKRIIITHPHFDHYGAAQGIRDVSGAEIWVYAEGAHWIEYYEEELDREESYRRTLLLNCGVPATEVEYVTRYYREANCFGRGAKVSRYLAVGDTFDLGPATFAVSHVPGHTPFCILLHDTDNTLAFTGDFLPPDIPANPLVQWTDIRSSEYRTTRSYVTSLTNVRAMSIMTALPGHGPIISDPNRRIDGLLSLIEKRRAAVLRALKTAGKTPFQIAREIFPGSSRESLFRTVSDVMGHLRILQDARIVEKRGQAFFLSRVK